MGINQESVLPLYYQLKEAIREEIESGVLKPDDCLPSERELCEMYKVSRATVRQALSDLEREGLLIRKQGKGTFVAARKMEEDLLGFYSFTRQMKEKGFDVSSRLLSIKAVNMPRGLARYFQLGSDEQVIQVIRLRLVNAEPLFLEKTYIPYKLCPGLLNEDLSSTPVYYELLTNKYNLDLKRVRKYLEPVIADDFEAKMLGIRKGSPMLLVVRITYSSDDKPVAICKWVVRGDRCRHYVEVYK